MSKRPPSQRNQGRKPLPEGEKRIRVNISMLPEHVKLTEGNRSPLIERLITQYFQNMEKVIHLVPETNMTRTVKLFIETPKQDERGYFFNETGKTHRLNIPDPRFCVAVFDEHNKLVHTENTNSKYFQSKAEALDLFDRVVEYWEVQAMIEKGQVLEAMLFLKQKYPIYGCAWGKYKHAPLNPFD